MLLVLMHSQNSVTVHERNVEQKQWENSSSGRYNVCSKITIYSDNICNTSCDTVTHMYFIVAAGDKSFA